jgi:drug/metabolite transporter (DMT)-like permease
VSGFILAIEGTPQAPMVATLLALLAAVSHAVFGALQKGRHDPWLSRGAIDFCYCAMALPVALFLVPWPQGWEWLLLAGAMLIHLVYKLSQAMAYARGAFTVVYPIVRGTGPLVTVLAAGAVFGEVYSAVQWSGVLMLSGGILALAAVNVVQAGVDRRVLLQAVCLALLTGLLTAAYTTYDAFGIRQTPDPFTFLAWFFVFDGLIFPWIALRHYVRMASPPEPWGLMRRGLAGGLIAYLSFGSVMLATRIDKVGQAAVLRETSVVFAALIGWLVLKERVGPLRGAFVVVIALGAIVVEFG